MVVNEIVSFENTLFFGCNGILTLWDTFKALMPRQNDCHFTDDTFKRIFINQIYEFRLKCHWSLLVRVQLTIFQHWFRQWLGIDQATIHYLNQWWLDYRRIYTSLSINELLRFLSHSLVTDKSAWWLKTAGSQALCNNRDDSTIS